MAIPKPHPLEYPPPTVRSGFRLSRRLIWLALGVIATIVSGLLLFIHQVNDSKCVQTMRAIGSVIRMYDNEYNSGYPPDLKILQTREDITPQVFYCPAEGAPSGAYVYWGNSKLTSSTVTARHVLLTEPPGNHTFSIHIMMGDDSVRAISRSQHDKVLRELQAGQNPPPAIK